MKVPCARCGEAHDLSALEPSYARPDPVDELPLAVREARVTSSRNFSKLAPAGRGEARHFVRALLPFRVTGRTSDCCWGLWVEVSQEVYDAAHRLWDDAEQALYGPWTGTVANDAPGYPPTRGLRGAVRFARFDQIPHLALDAAQDHPFVKDWLHGVTEERMAALQMLLLHPAG